MFLLRRFRPAKSLPDADVVVWTGGSDVNPELYKEKCLSDTRYNIKRDEDDARAWGESLGQDNAQLRVGICRGGQFLNVMNGGKMWQDVDGHTKAHDIIDLEHGLVLEASSTHHQMMIPDGAKAEIIAVANDRVATYKVAFGREWVADKDPEESLDYEVLWYPDTASLCFQPHPEYSGYNALTNYFFDLIEIKLEQILFPTPKGKESNVA